MDARVPLRHAGPMTQHQPFASVIALAPDTGQITHASANCAGHFGHHPAGLLGAPLRELLGAEVSHAVRNAAALPDFATGSVRMSDAGPLAEGHDLRAFASGALYVIELSRHRPCELGATPVLDVARAAMMQFLPLDSTADLAAALTRFVHRVTGYDHVVLWQPPAPGRSDAVVVAEAKRRSREIAMGQAAPWSELWQPGDPALAMISDRTAQPVPVLSCVEASPPLDLSSAYCDLGPVDRAAHLKANTLSAALQMRLTCRGRIWGVLECQNVSARRPSAQVLSLSKALLPYLDAKLQSLV